jgi:hypothetical protein
MCEKGVIVDYVLNVIVWPMGAPCTYSAGRGRRPYDLPCASCIITLTFQCDTTLRWF